MTTIENDKAVSMKRLVGPAKMPATVGETLWLFRVFGCVTGTKESFGDSGLKKKYLGDFIGEGLVGAGKEKEIRRLQADELHLPTIADEMMEKAGVGAPGTFTEFGLKIGIANQSGKPTYLCEFLLPPTQTSPAAAIVAKHAPELTSNAPVADKAAAPAGKAAKR